MVYIYLGVKIHLETRILFLVARKLFLNFTIWRKFCCNLNILSVYHFSKSFCWVIIKNLQSITEPIFTFILYYCRWFSQVENRVVWLLHTHKILMYEIDIGNLKTRNFTKLILVRNFYSSFWVKRLFDMRRERHNLLMLTAFTSSAFNPTNARRP